MTINNTNINEMFEPKDGINELRERINKLTDRQEAGLFRMLLGAYSSTSHYEWLVFRNRVEEFLKYV